MDTIKNIETIGRKAWLAGIGAYGSSWNYAVDKFDETYAKTNEFVSELVSEGEKIEKEIQEKIKAKVVIDSKVFDLKNKLGLNQLSDIERIEALTHKVDDLTVLIAKLVESKVVKKTPKAKPAVKKVAAKQPVAKKAAVKKPVAKKTVTSQETTATKV